MKTMLIGATSGIGREIAALLASQRESLVLIGRDNEELLRIANDLVIRYGVRVELGLFDAKGAPNKALHRTLAECSRVIVAVGFLGE